MSLTDQIRAAETTSDVEKLLALGETYEHASNGTVAKWLRVAKQRVLALTHAARATVVDPADSEPA